MAKYRDKVTFNVPATAGTYASERLTFGIAATGAEPEELDAVTMLVVTPSLTGGVAATGAIAELWLPQVRPSARPVPDGEYFNTGQTVNVGAGNTFPLASWKGAQIRLKSGGTAGTVDVSAAAE